MLVSRLPLSQALQPGAPPRAHMRMENLCAGLGAPRAAKDTWPGPHVPGLLSAPLSVVQTDAGTARREAAQPHGRQPCRKRAVAGVTASAAQSRGPEFWEAPSSRDTTGKGNTCVAPRTPQTPRPLHQPPPAMGLGTAASQAGLGQRPPMLLPRGRGCFLQPPSGCGAARVLPTGRGGRGGCPPQRAQVFFVFSWAVPAPSGSKLVPVEERSFGAKSRCPQTRRLPTQHGRPHACRCL